MCVSIYIYIYIYLQPWKGAFQVSYLIELWEYDNLFHELLEPNRSDSHFTGSSIYKRGIFYWMAHGFALTSNKKGRKKYYITSFLYWLKLRCCVKRRIAIRIRYTIKTPSVPLLKISQRWNLSEFPFTDPIFHRINPPLLLYMNMWSLTCLEAWDNVLLLILLPIFDIGSFIVNLYLPYLLDELRGLVYRYNLCNFMVYTWIGEFLFGRLQLLS